MIHKGKFIINYAHAGNGKIPFMESLLQFQEYDFHNENLRDGFCGCGGSFVTTNRNEAIDLFLKRDTKPEFAIFLDTDVKFEPWMIYQLYEECDAKEHPIVSGVYSTYIDTTFAPVFFRRLTPEQGGDQGFEEYRTLDTIEPRLQELDAIGMGAVIIHRSVLEAFVDKYGARYERDEWIWFGHDLIKTRKGMRRLGEDMTFSRRARELGFKIWGDGRLDFGHIKERVENYATLQERFYAKQFGEAVAEDARMKEAVFLDKVYEGLMGLEPGGAYEQHPKTNGAIWNPHLNDALREVGK